MGNRLMRVVITFVGGWNIGIRKGRMGRGGGWRLGIRSIGLRGRGIRYVCMVGYQSWVTALLTLY